MPTYRSPAKINVFLKILRRREDGYHELASLFQAVSLYDILSFNLAQNSDTFTCSNPKIPTDERNLVMKALFLFRKYTGCKQVVAIHLEKHIPSEAGLGGGSSNAATTLWALNELFNRPATEEELRLWGAEIGSDVPFFLSHGTAYCQGRGEVIQEVCFDSPSRKLTLTKPAFGMGTVEVYKNLDVTKLQLRHPHQDLQQTLAGKPTYYNDLEIAAFEVNTDLRAFKELINADHVLLSGSGSTFFCIGENVTVPQGCWNAEVAYVNRPKGAWY